MNIFHIPFISDYFQQILFTLRVSSLLFLLNDASVDIVDDEGSFQFSLKTEFTPSSYVHITLAAGIEVEAPCFTQTATVLKTY